MDFLSLSFSLDTIDGKTTFDCVWLISVKYVNSELTIYFHLTVAIVTNIFTMYIFKSTRTYIHMLSIVFWSITL